MLFTTFYPREKPLMIVKKIYEHFPPIMFGDKVCGICRLNYTSQCHRN